MAPSISEISESISKFVNGMGSKKEVVKNDMSVKPEVKPLASNSVSQHYSVNKADSAINNNMDKKDKINKEGVKKEGMMDAISEKTGKIKASFKEFMKKHAQMKDKPLPQESNEKKQEPKVKKEDIHGKNAMDSSIQANDSTDSSMNKTFDVNDMKDDNKATDVISLVHIFMKPTETKSKGKTEEAKSKEAQEKRNVKEFMEQKMFKEATDGKSEEMEEIDEQKMEGKAETMKKKALAKDAKVANVENAKLEKNKKTVAFSFDGIASNTKDILSSLKKTVSKIKKTPESRKTKKDAAVKKKETKKVE